MRVPAWTDRAHKSPHSSYERRLSARFGGDSPCTVVTDLLAVLGSLLYDVSTFLSVPFVLFRKGQALPCFFFQQRLVCIGLSFTSRKGRWTDLYFCGAYTFSSRQKFSLYWTIGISIGFGREWPILEWIPDKTPLKSRRARKNHIFFNHRDVSSVTALSQESWLWLATACNLIGLGLLPPEKLLNVASVVQHSKWVDRIS